MSIRSRSFYSFLNSIIENFRIHICKKKYYWGEKHCQSLFDNIVLTGTSNERKSHFIGSIVHSLHEKEGTNECVIIDGHQRVVTIILLYIALYKFAKKMNNNIGKQQTITRMNYICNSFLNKSLIKNIENLVPKETCQEIFKHLIVTDSIKVSDKVEITDETDVADNLKLFARMAKNFEYFSRRIDENNFNAIRKGIEKIVFIEITLESQYVEHYNKLLYSTGDADKDIKPYLWYNIKLGIKYAYIFLAKVYYDYDNQLIDKTTFIEVLSFVQAFLWRRIIAGHSIGGMSKCFTTLHNSVDKNNYLRSVQQNLLQHSFPTDSEIKKVLKEKNIDGLKPDHKIYLFEKLENYQNTELSPLNFSKVFIEHIFPPNPVPQWRVELGDAEYQEMEKSLHLLGNLTVSYINAEMENLYFTDKQNMNRNNKQHGYKYSSLWLNSSLQGLERWDKKALEARTKELTERFLTVWKLPTARGISKTSTVGIIKKIINKIFGK